MKQILIEKYIEPSEVQIGKYGIVFKRWFDRNYELHSFMSQPAEVGVENGMVSSQAWYKNGIRHRNKNFPARIFYNNMEITHKSWYKNGVHIKSRSY